MSSNFTWTCRKNSTRIDIRVIPERKEVFEHPLQRFTTRISIASKSQAHKLKNEQKPQKKSSSVLSDPLGVILDGKDPLSVFQKQSRRSPVEEFDEWDNDDISNANKYKGLQPWSLKKEDILSQFGSQEVLAMTKCFSLQDKGTSRLKSRSNRDDFEDGIIFEINDMMPNDFYRRLENFHNEVVRTWNEDQRVKALKIVIQSSKLLSDSYSCWFYPNKFIYVTDILDTFGDLVYTRLKAKCQQLWKPDVKSMKSFPDNFTSEIVPDAAKETCLNWFYKIASIRELIPRLYVEAALLRSYSFIKTGENGRILSRLQKLVRGVGDPLVNVYLRCYICRVGVLFGAAGYNFFGENFDEFMAIYESIYEKQLVLLKGIEVEKYLEAYSPALEWLIQGMIADDENTQCKLYDSFTTMKNNSLLLLVMLNSFKSSFVLLHSSAIIDWIGKCNFNEVPVAKYLKCFANCYEKHMKQHMGIISSDILDSIWSLVDDIQDPGDFIGCVDQWITLSITNLPPNRVEGILRDLVTRMIRHNVQDKYYSQLENIVRNLTRCIDDFMSLLIAHHFLPFINIFRNETVKVTVCKTIMEGFVKRSHETFINDAVVLNNLMVTAKIIHDSITSLTVEDEKRQIGNLLSKFVQRIDFGRDFEQQLEFYVEARGAFFNLDVVHIILVHCVNKLSYETLKVVKGRHTSKTSAFVRACSAFCYITVPTLPSSISRFQLYMLSGQVALANQCLGQAEACFKAVIETIREFPKTIESGHFERRCDSILRSYVKELFSVFLIVPDNPSEKHLHLMKDLIENLSYFSWEEHNSAKASMYIQVLHAYNVAYQDEYPYHFLNVDSNDVLYASDVFFQLEISKICSVMAEEILKFLYVLGSSGQTAVQSKLACRFFYCILLRGDLANLWMAKLAVKVWNMANKNDFIIDSRVAVKTLQHCIHSSPPDSPQADIFSKLLAKIA